MPGISFVEISFVVAFRPVRHDRASDPKTRVVVVGGVLVEHPVQVGERHTGVSAVSYGFTGRLWRRSSSTHESRPFVGGSFFGNPGAGEAAIRGGSDVRELLDFLGAVG